MHDHTELIQCFVALRRLEPTNADTVGRRAVLADLAAFKRKARTVLGLTGVWTWEMWWRKLTTGELQDSVHFISSTKGYRRSIFASKLFEIE